MIKIYFLGNILALGEAFEFHERDNWDYSPVDSAAGRALLEQTNMADFFAISKRKALIFDSTSKIDDFMKSLEQRFTVIEAGGGLVTNPEGDTLMIFRNGRWDLPKGKREVGEEIETCALREVGEECGIEPSSLSIDRFLHHTYHVYTMEGRLVLKRTWWYAMNHSGVGQLEPQLVEGITKVKWVSKAEVVCYIAETYPTIQDVFISELL